MKEQGRRGLKQALELPAIERTSLVEKLFSGFDFPARQEIDKQQAHEAEGQKNA